MVITRLPIEAGFFGNVVCVGRTLIWVLSCSVWLRRKRERNRGKEREWDVEFKGLVTLWGKNMLAPFVI